MIMQVSRVAPITLCQNESQVSERCQAAMTSDPATPQAAHSVALAQPVISTRNTSAISSSTGRRFRRFLSFARSWCAVRAAEFSSGSRATERDVTAVEYHHQKTGKKPARKIWMIETSAATA